MSSDAAPGARQPSDTGASQPPATAGPAPGGAFGVEMQGAAERSPDQLDQLVRLTPRRTWLNVTAIVLISLAAAAFSFYGETGVVVTGAGVMLPTDGLSEVLPIVDGLLKEVEVRTGDRVTVGQTVARVYTDPQTLVEVPSLVDGVVVEVLAGPGDAVGPTISIARVQSSEQQLVAYTFMPVSDGQKINPGMRVDIAADSAPSEQYGMIEGKVTGISLLPVSTQRLEFLSGHSQTVVGVLQQQGPSLEMQIELATADTPSGYRWTTGRGPNFAITAGTILRPTIVLSSESLVSRVFS